VRGTTSWMSPEMRKICEKPHLKDNESIKLDYSKLDVFSLGLISLFCLNYEEYNKCKDHLNDNEVNLLNLLKNTKSKVPLNYYYLLKSMLSFNEISRPSLTELYEDVKYFGTFVEIKSMKEETTQSSYTPKGVKVDLPEVTQENLIRNFQKREVTNEDIKNLMKEEKFKKFQENSSKQIKSSKLDIDLYDRSTIFLFI
jgi:hypothetical protein